MPYGKPIIEPPPPPKSPPPLESPPEPLRFSLAQLLIGTTIAAVLLALFRAIGIWGAVLSFGAAMIFTLLIYPQARRGQAQEQGLMFDFVWGIVMPVVCLVFDPFVFKEQAGSPFDFAMPLESLSLFRLRDTAFLAYPILAWQLAVMALVLVQGRVASEWAALIAGTLFVGWCAAAVIGIVLIPFSIFGTAVLIGILGYTPLFTAYSYSRRSREMWRQAGASGSRKRAWALALAGAILALAIPAGVGALASAARQAYLGPPSPSMGDR